MYESHLSETELTANNANIILKLYFHKQADKRSCKKVEALLMISPLVMVVFLAMSLSTWRLDEDHRPNVSTTRG